MSSATDPGPAKDIQRRHHMLIAGTGRAGTSFLVRYLAELGLETEISRSGEAHWNEHAQAGLETIPLLAPSDRLPYVIKSPWIHEFIDQLLAQAGFTIDAVIVPVRDLIEAAASRVILERNSIYASHPDFIRFDKAWESWGTTPGGLLYSLSPIDQSRILAVGFYHLMQRLVKSDIPIVLLDFPRITEDWEYLNDKLRNFLPGNISSEAAKMAHATVARRQKVRVGSELYRPPRDQSPAESTAGALQYPDHDALDAIALKRELGRMRGEHERLQTEHASARAEHERLQVEHAGTRVEHKRLEAEHAVMRVEHERLQAEHASMRVEHERVQAEHASMRVEHERLQAEHASMRVEHEKLQAEHASMRVEHERLQAEHASMRAGREQDLASYKQLQFDKARLATDHESAKAAFDHLLEETGRLRVEHCHLKLERDALIASHSWKWTAPLRRIRRIFMSRK